MEKFTADFGKINKAADKSKKESYQAVEPFKIHSQDLKKLTEKQLFSQFAILKQQEVVRNVTDFLFLCEQPEFKKLLEMLNDKMTLVEALNFLKQTVEEINLEEAKEKGLKNLPRKRSSGQIH